MRFLGILTTDYDNEKMQKSKKQSVPKYYRISQEIIAGIRKGDLPSGGKVPSENEIIKTYKVSNTTARKVLRTIENAGWVKRIKGKGTYVHNNSVDRSINRILSFTRNMTEQGRIPGTRVLSIKMRRSSHSVLIHGRRYTIAGPFCEIQRLRLADGIPMMKEVRYISTRFCPGIEKLDLESSLYEIYKQIYGLNLERILQSLSSAIIEGRDLEIFGLTRPTSAFFVEGVTLCGKEQIIEIEESIYRGDMYRFSVEAT